MVGKRKKAKKRREIRVSVRGKRREAENKKGRRELGWGREKRLRRTRK